MFKYHSQANLKSNSLMAMPKAWQRLSGCLNSREKVLSSTFPKVMTLGTSMSFSSSLSSTKMKFFIEACFTRPPKLSAKDCRRSFHLGSLFLYLTTFGSPRVDKDSPSENLQKSKSSSYLTLGRRALSLRGPFMPRKLLSYSMQAMLTLNLDRSMSLLGCWPLSQSWQTEPVALPLSLPRQAGLFLSISLVRLMQQLQPMQPRWFSQKRMGRWSSPMAWKYSLKPLWQRLKYTKECWLGLRGSQMAVLRSSLLDPAFCITTCIITQLSAGFLLSSFFDTICCMFFVYNSSFSWSDSFSSSYSCLLYSSFMEASLCLTYSCFYCFSS